MFHHDDFYCKFRSHDTILIAFQTELSRLNFYRSHQNQKRALNKLSTSVMELITLNSKFLVL